MRCQRHYLPNHVLIPGFQLYHWTRGLVNLTCTRRRRQRAWTLQVYHIGVIRPMGVGRVPLIRWVLVRKHLRFAAGHHMEV